MVFLHISIESESNNKDSTHDDEEVKQKKVVHKAGLWSVAKGKIMPFVNLTKGSIEEINSARKYQLETHNDKKWVNLKRFQ